MKILPRLRPAIVPCVLAVVSLLGMSSAGVADSSTSTKAAARSNTTTTAVQGVAWSRENAPLQGFNVRLRNAHTGAIAARSVTDGDGRFRFDNIEPGSYVVELVDANGRVITTGQAFSIAPGETVATFVRLGTKIPWFNGFFSNAAAAAISTAASSGVTAVAPAGIPATPGS